MACPVINLNNFTKATVMMINPGPEINFPIPVKSFLRIPSPSSAFAMAPEKELNIFNKFSIAGVATNSPSEAARDLTFTEASFIRVLKVVCNCSLRLMASSVALFDCFNALSYIL